MEPTMIEKQTREADIEAIRQVVATVQHATQNELAEEFVGLFRADAIWTTGGGKRLVGRDRIAAFTQQVLPGGMTGLTITSNGAWSPARTRECSTPDRQISAPDDTRPGAVLGPPTVEGGDGSGDPRRP
jgi:SnoaL-like domain